MLDIILFVEDYGHEAFLEALVQRFAREYQISIKTSFPIARGGYGKVISNLKGYISGLQNDQTSIPDLLIIATDGNCKGYSQRKRDLEVVTKDFSGNIVYAIPDPHIERWLLLDSSAFKKVLGKGCAAPTKKCERALYKRLLLEAVRGAGINPLLAVIEYAEDLVNAMDLDYLERTEELLNASTPNVRNRSCETSLKPDARPQETEAHSANSHWKHIGKLLKALRQQFGEWANVEHGGPLELHETTIPYILHTQAETPQA